MSSAATALATACDSLTATSLEQVQSVADLQTRVDRKYLVPAASFADLIGRTGERLSVLTIGRRHQFDYESVYFDTSDLIAHRRHAHGRRRRFKIRTRSYVDSGQTVLEVKTEGGRGETIKDRHPYRLADRYQLTPDARTIVAQQIGDHAAAHCLDLSLITRYLRTTLVDYSTGSRLTCDVDMVFSDHQRNRPGPDDLVLIESKTTGKTAAVDTLLWRMGHRPVSISKYCAGLALLDPDLPANPWNRVLRRAFAWEPTRRR
ncbi:MAG: VTC domain-containing protein [Pseudonocardia sp.]|nr:VTC domain-containing protein [Pseudonocardia sp.]